MSLNKKTYEKPKMEKVDIDFSIIMVNRSPGKPPVIDFPTGRATAAQQEQEFIYSSRTFLDE